MLSSALRSGNALRLSALTLLCAAPLALVAMDQSAASPRPLITQAIDERSLISLRGNTHPAALPAQDRGAAPVGMPAERLLLVLKRSPEQQAALQTYLQQLQTPGSPNFGKFVTPEQFGLLYGASTADLAILQNWLQSLGFSVAKIGKGRSAIEFSGTVGQVQQAFHTQIHHYERGGSLHWANTADPMIPSALAPIVAGIAGLNDFKPHPQLRAAPSTIWKASNQRFTPSLTASLNGAPYLLLGPGDAATIYNSPNGFNKAWPPGQAPLDGTGIDIGLVENVLIDFAPVQNYESLFALPMYNEEAVYDGNEDSLYVRADDSEFLLDNEVARAVAPGAHITVYSAADSTFQPGILLAALRAVDDNVVSFLSVSYLGCEADQGAAGNQEIFNTWEQAAAQGITVTVSSGDSGSAGCDDFNQPKPATQGFAVNGLASTPFNVAVGGTDFNALNKSFATYANPSPDGGFTTALGYIPENVWNISTATTGPLSGNTIFKDQTGAANIVAGGGGLSSAGDWSSGAPAGYLKPIWQQSYPPSNTDSVRDLPDVSLFAGSGENHAAWAVCLPRDCQSGGETIHAFGGTSASAPAFAAMLAIVNQKIGASVRLGQANWVLYKLAQTTPAVFHKISTSNNAVYCTAGSPNCGANSFLTGYETNQGYSLAAGLGSVDVSLLASSWQSDVRAATSTSLTVDKSTFKHGTAVNINTAVNPAAATGSIALVSSGAGMESMPPLALVNGAGAGTYTQLPGGTYTLFGNYAGDGKYQGSTSPGVALAVSPEDSNLQLSLSAFSPSRQLVSVAGASVPLGTLIFARAVPIGLSQSAALNPIANATGTVFFQDDASPFCVNYPAAVDASGGAEFQLLCGAGTHDISATYNGDASYNPSSAGPIAFTVLKAPTSVSLSSSAATISMGFLDVTATLALNPPTLMIFPTGVINFTNTTTNTLLGSPVPSAGTCATGKLICDSVVLNVYVSQLILGQNLITATFAGDGNFTPSDTSVPLAVTCTAGCGNGTGQFLSIGVYGSFKAVVDAGSQTTDQIDVTGSGGFTGAVDLSCIVKPSSTGDIHLPTCSFAPPQVTITNEQSPPLVTVTIQTVAPGSKAQPGVGPTKAHLSTGSGAWEGVASSMLAFALVAWLPAARRRWSSFLASVLCAVVFSAMLACGGSGTSSNSSGAAGTGGTTTVTPGTTADTYTVIFHAVDVATGTLTAEQNFTLIVDPAPKTAGSINGRDVHPR